MLTYREAISLDIVTKLGKVDQSRTIEQKEEGTATLAILKSRFGKDGVIFEDILFDNGSLKIDTTMSTDVSFLDFEKGEEKKKSQMVTNALKKKREVLGGK